MHEKFTSSSAIQIQTSSNHHQRCNILQECDTFFITVFTEYCKYVDFQLFRQVSAAAYKDDDKATTMVLLPNFLNHCQSLFNEVKSIAKKRIKTCLV